jgi:tRNA(Met) C34 N-acetyltransferase TmcA
MVGKNMSDDVSLHRGQSKVIKDLFIDNDTRYVVVNASRGFGKTYLAAVAAMIACQELMDLPEDVPNKNVAIIAPTYSQGVDIYYPLLAYILGL